MPRETKKRLRVLSHLHLLTVMLVVGDVQQHWGAIGDNAVCAQCVDLGLLPASLIA